jgi:histidine triad (HIT) family protein
MRGHTLVVPKQETDYIFDLPDEFLSEIMTFARPVAKAIEKAIPCARIGIAVIGLEVPHAHVHLIPINEVKDMDFTKTRPMFSKEEFEATAAEIRKYIS